MVGPWPHRPGTLRALLTILKSPFFIVCYPCQRYARMEFERLIAAATTVRLLGSQEAPPMRHPLLPVAPQARRTFSR